MSGADILLRDEPEAVEAELVEPKLIQATEEDPFLARIEKIDLQLYETNANTLIAASRWKEISPGDKVPPESWIREYGEKRALEVFRVAQASWLPSSEAPVGLVISEKIVNGIRKAKSKENAPAPTLNVAIIQMPAEFNFPERVIEDGSSRRR